jgi:hypothetical protein
MGADTKSERLALFLEEEEVGAVVVEGWPDFSEAGPIKRRVHLKEKKGRKSRKKKRKERKDEIDHESKERVNRGT